MNFTALSPSVQVTILFFLALLPVCFVMKWVAFRGAPQLSQRVLFLSLFPTPVAEQRALPLSAATRLLRRFLVGFAACICVYWSYYNFLQGLPPILLSYFGALVLWMVTETIGSLVPLLAMPSGCLLPLPHGAPPPLARSVSDFWGRRWNTWLSDWFRQVIFQPLRSRPVPALFLVFLASGVLHEWVINVPLYIVTGKIGFGSMILYFLLQAFGILLERKVRRRAFRIVLVWLVVFGPAPLIVNEGLLRVLALWPE